MLKQIINGKTVATLYVEGLAADMDALKGLLEGRVDEYELKGQGGTSAPLPTVLDTRRIVVKDTTSGLSTSFRVWHLKDAKNVADIESALVGNFDASYNQSVTCDYAELIYDNNKS